MVLLWRSDFKLALKVPSGKPRNFATTRSSGRTLRSATGIAESRCARIASIARSSCALRFCLAICFTRFLDYACAQFRERAELQLLDRAFRLSQRECNLTDAFFFGEPHLDDAALDLWKLLDQAKKPGTLLDFLRATVFTRRFVRRCIPPLARGSMPTIGYAIGGNPKQPGGEGNPAH